ncbi:MAG: tRNA pseudouridine(55) synthase TruB [Bacillota bacterium]|nr:MAG: tRNA pseudouridine(55) synthase TruB [Bacillota bacterium]
MARRTDAPDGGIILWKPRGPSSRALLDQVQQRLQWRGLGHCGTLDPLASGVMVLIGGAARRFQQLLTGHDKRYLATVWLGVASGSDDAEGPLYCPVPAPRWPTTDQIAHQLEKMTGQIEQVPPAYSAVRIAGRRSYQRARAGDTTAPPARTVTVHSMQLIEHDQQRLRLEIACGSGTYIRSIARDLGRELGCQASLMALRRSASGSHDASMAVLPDRVVASDWLSLEQLLAAQPRIEVSREQALRLAQGQRLPVDEVTGGNTLADALAAEGRGEGPLVVWSEERVRGLARISDGVLRPRRWLAASDNDTSD